MIPSASIVVPILNEVDFVKGCLNQILNQTYINNIKEIFFIDGMSTDGTRQLIQNELEQIRNKRNYNNDNNNCYYHDIPNIYFIDNPKGQRTSALNIGVNKSEGDLIIRIDARTIIPIDYVEKCIKTYLDTSADNVGGIQKPMVNSMSVKWLSQAAIGIALSHPFGVGNARFRIGKTSGYTDTVYLGCFKRAVFKKIGLFDEESTVISEDSDINFRIRQSGGCVYFNKDIVAFYNPRESLRDLYKLYFRYGGAKAGNLLRRKTLTAFRQVLPPLFLFTLVILPICSMFNKVFFFLWLIEIGFYISIDFASSFHAINKKKDVNIIDGKRTLTILERFAIFIRLLVVFPIMHLSWAMGFWRRILQWKKNRKYWRY